ncbi:hypothetical protein KIL84_023441 [Mauremys mutica]|uniref:Histone H2A n=1 Tax=Mauremys mutica TaxID=74926 RepID=A0A9D4ALY1_9SAUR|nr:hypothetical protein KIL84_023441 [Mauremys mutica]
MAIKTGGCFGAGIWLINKISLSGVWNHAERVGASAPVYLAMEMEHLTAEILELAGNTARDNKKTHIIPCAQRREAEQAAGGVTVAQGGVLPNIQAVLLPKKTESHKAKGK